MGKPMEFSLLMLLRSRRETEKYSFKVHMIIVILS